MPASQAQRLQIAPTASSAAGVMSLAHVAPPGGSIDLHRPKRSNGAGVWGGTSTTGGPWALDRDYPGTGMPASVRLLYHCALRWATGAAFALLLSMARPALHPPRNQARMISADAVPITLRQRRSLRGGHPGLRGRSSRLQVKRH